jgi:hypothetical protein
MSIHCFHMDNLGFGNIDNDVDLSITCNKGWRYQRGNQKSLIQGQTMQWPEEKGQKEKQQSTKHNTTLVTLVYLYHMHLWNTCRIFDRRGRRDRMSYGSWIYNYLCIQCLSPLMLWVQISIRARCTTSCYKVCQWLATGRWFSPGPHVHVLCV